MSIAFSKLTVTPIAVTLIAAMLLLLFDYIYGQKQVQMTRVGGEMNQCTCSQRLEK
jgi:hypothetical protein